MKDKLQKMIEELQAMQKSMFGVDEVAYRNLGNAMARLIDVKKTLT